MDFVDDGHRRGERSLTHQLKGKSRRRREGLVAMASGEMTDAEFLAFNEAWMAAVLPCLCDGGVFGTLIDWRGYPTVHSAAVKLGLTPLNLVVWALVGQDSKQIPPG